MTYYKSLNNLQTYRLISPTSRLICFNYGILYNLNNFSTSSRLYMDKKDILGKIIDLEQESKSLREDREKAYKHMVGITKEEFGQEQTKEQLDSINHIKESYSVFFEDDSEEEQSSSKDKTVQSKEREQLAGVVGYIKDEIIANNAQYMEIIQGNPELFTYISGKLTLKPEYRTIGEQEFLKTAQDKPSGQESSKKRTLDETYEEESSKRIQFDKSSDESKSVTDPKKQESSKSVHEYVETLAENYNPFDDTGTD